MTEEEKKAIKYLRRNVIVRIDIDENKNEKIVGYGNSHKYILLKLIKRQQKEIEELKEKNASLQKEIEERNTRLQEEINENCKLKTELYGNSISKDKIREKINYYEERGYIEIAGALEELLEE